MERQKSEILLLCLFTTFFFSGVQTHGSNISEKNVKENQITIQIGSLRITNKAIDLRCEIKNNSEHDVWIFSGRSRRSAEVLMDLKDHTLVISRRINPPILPGLMSNVFESYDLLRAGQSRHVELTAHLPIRRFEEFERGFITATNQGIDEVMKLAFEIGYFTTEDLESLKENISSIQHISFEESGDQVYIGDVTQGSICLAERATRLTLDGSCIPFKQWLNWAVTFYQIVKPKITNIQALEDLFYSFSIGLEEYQYAQHLFGFDKDLLNKKDRKILDIYIQLAEGKFEPSELTERLDRIINSSDREKWLKELKNKQAAIDKKKQAKVEHMLSIARHLDKRDKGRMPLNLLREILSIDPSCDEAFDLICKNSAYYLGQTITNSIGMRLVWIPAGEFLMGSKNAAFVYQPHKVRISRGFWMGEHEVSQAQYKELMGWNPSRLAKDDETAIGNVSWLDAKEFCRRLSQKDGKSYRLPSEAEWEYACRAGTSTDYWWGDDAESDVSGANPFGLYNMHSNVGEWCQDYFGCYYYFVSPELNPKGPKEIDVSEKIRVVRGCDIFYRSYVRDKKDAYYKRYYLEQDKSQENVGFRVVLDEN